jgi:hypothetical protein
MIGASNIMKLRKCSLFASIVGALLLTAAFAPRANAVLAVYFNFEDATLGGPFDPAADVVGAPDFNPGGGIQASTLATNLTVTAAVAGFLDNRTASDTDTANPGLAIGMRTTPVDNGHYIQFAVNATLLSNMSLSFAVSTAGNGFNSVQFSYFVNGVETIVSSQPILTGPTQTIPFAVPAPADFQSTLVSRLTFTGGTSMGNSIETTVDNIQLNATVVPEPSTYIGGLLGIVGLCWFQRRRLISFLRLRYA